MNPIELKVEALPLVASHPDGPMRAFDVILIQTDPDLSGSATLTVKIRNGLEYHRQLEPLDTSPKKFEVILPELDKAWQSEWIIKCGGRTAVQTLSVEPAREWEVYISLHSHVDLGFTGSLSEVAAIHNENTDRALDHIDETSHWQGESQFHWTLEVSWQAEQYMLSRSEGDIERLIRTLRSGRMELGGLYAGEHPDALGHEEAVRAFYLAGRLRRQWKIPVETALLCDVPGSTAGWVQMMAQAGIRNFIIADNNFGAPVLRDIDLPRPFEWEAPTGDTVTTWYTDHPFYAYWEGKRWGIATSVEEARKKIPEMLLRQERKGYPYRNLHIQYAYDNFRLEFTPAEVVRDWNAKWIWPRLRLSTPRHFFDALRKEAGGTFPHRKGDLNEWWIGACAHYPVEVALSKRLQDEIPRLEILNRMVDPALISTLEFDGLWHGLLAWDEHSGNGQVWNGEDPKVNAAALQEGYGKIYDAHGKATELKARFNTSVTSNTDISADGEVTVLNTLAWKRSGLVHLQELDPGTGVALFEGDRQISPVGMVSSAGQVDLPVPDIPGLGFRTFRLRTGISRTEPKTPSFSELRKYLDTGIGRVSFWESVMDPPIEMGRYIPEIYEGKPGVLKELNIPDGSTQEIIEKIDEDGTAVLIVRYLLDSHYWLTRQISPSKTGSGIRMSYTFHNEGLVSTEFFDRLGATPGAPTAVYVVFPGGEEQSSLVYDAPGQILQAGDDQFPGSCFDMYAIGRWALLSGKHSGTAVYPRDALVAEPDGPALTQYRQYVPDKVSELWFRIMPANAWDDRQWGMGYHFQDLELYFEIEDLTGMDPMEQIEHAHRKGTELTSPLFTLRGSTGDQINSGNDRFMDMDGAGVEVMTLKLAEDGSGDTLLRLREYSGQERRVELRLPVSEMVECTLLEDLMEEWQPVPDQRVNLEFKPFQIKTMRFRGGRPL